MNRALALAAVLPLALAACTTPAGDQTRGTEVHLSGSGDAKIEQGELFGNRFQGGTGTLRLDAVDFADGGGRVTSLPPHDKVDLTASVESQGHRYEVRATHAMVSDPLGRFTTWWGVGLHVDHHGNSGIGTAKLPAITSTVALFALGDVSVDGKQIATGVPVHVMTADEGGLAENGKLELDIGDPDVGAVLGLPDGHLRVLWPSVAVDAPQSAHVLRYAVGTLVLVGMIVAGLWLNRREPLAARP